MRAAEGPCTLLTCVCLKHHAVGAQRLLPFGWITCSFWWAALCMRGDVRYTAVSLPLDSQGSLSLVLPWLTPSALGPPCWATLPGLDPEASYGAAYT